MSETIRAFIAIELDKPVQEALSQIQGQLKKSQADVKWVAPQNIHLTLKFLGDVLSDKREDLRQILPEVLSNISGFELEINQLGAFPKIQRPRVVWVGITKNADKVKEIATLLEEKLQTLGLEREDREFSAHITLGRVRSPKNLNHLGQAMENCKILKPLKQAVKNVTLFQSTLTPQGPIYTPLLLVPLKSFTHIPA
jgi:RNA 2',3'-cyclic 3'-phosphodiesterase